jgi:N-acetylneuraminic acid mutarotase
MERLMLSVPIRTLSRIMLGSAIGLVGCSTDQIQAPSSPKASLAISDAVHNNGNAHFYFLPPMVARPITSGALDAAAEPSLTICSLAATTEAEVTPATTCDGRYSVAIPFGTTGSAVVQLHTANSGDAEDDESDNSEQGGHYHFNWRVPSSAITFYRIVIKVGDTSLGFADVETANNNRDLRHVQTGEFIPRRDGTTLPIKFRVEDGAVPPPPASWVGLTGMPTARQWVSTASDGQRFYAIGGWSEANLAVNEVYDPTTQAWMALASMPAARYAGTGAQVIGTKLYVAGGSPGYPAMSNSLFIYDILANSWSTGASAPTNVGCGASATVGGRLFVFGGCSTSFVYDSSFAVYDPAAGSWTALQSAPHTHLYPSAVAVGSKIYVISGINDEANTIDGAVDIYDTATGQWTAGPALPTPRYSASAAVIGSKIYVIGGTTSPSSAALDVVEAFDTVSQTWSSAIPMPTARWDAGAAVLSGRILVAGGTASGLSWFNTVEAFRP